MLSNCSMSDSKNKPGDQANLGKNNGGEEYGLINWYNKPWLGILRYSGDKKDEVRSTISKVATAAAKNNNIGYSQARRGTYLTQLKKVGYDPSKIKTKCDADCSSSTIANVIAAGNLCGISKLKKASSSVSSQTIRVELQKRDFKYYDDKKYRNGESSLKPGDILVASGHVAIYVGNGKDSSVGSSSSSSSSSGPVFHPRYTKDGQPAKTGWYGPSKNRFQLFGPTGGNCTWYAYGRFCEIAQKQIKLGKTGNAMHFYDEGYFPTCKRGKTPKLGAIICWKYANASGEPGHVAVVEEIKDNGNKIRITQSGYGGGWNCNLGNKDVWLTKSHNYEDVGLIDKCVFRGFIYNPVSFNDSGVATGGDYSSDESSGTGINMQQRIATLYSSDNYQYLSTLEDTTNKALSPIQKLLNNVKESTVDLARKTLTKSDIKPIFSETIQKILDAMQDALAKATKDLASLLIKQALNRDTNSIFNISRYLVEAPFVEVKIGNIKIGSYRGSIDKYPNYITGLEVTKTNGEINNYTIQIVHQIRIGEDPNLLDKVFAQNQFNKITISYGDTDSAQKFNDINAIITKITMNRDYASARITYNVEAISAGSFITAHTMNFPAVTDKPSNVIRKLLFSSPISNELKQAFPGMSSKTFVDSKGMIPNNDKVLNIQAKKNIDPISYINYLVSCMSNAKNKGKLNDSSYFIFYKDDQQNGAQFEIKEIKSSAASNSYNAVYEATVGYPDENNIFTFNVSNDKAWSIMYDKNISATSAQEYVYTIESNGDIKKYYSPNLNSASQQLGERNKNWWSFMTTFPISATLTMRGLLRPAFLTNYIKINVVFYGQKHITSGLYAITEQKDSLSGSGFRTTFSLIRVGSE